MEEEWQPTPVSSSGESQDGGALRALEPKVTGEPIQRAHLLFKASPESLLLVSASTF